MEKALFNTFRSSPRVISDYLRLLPESSLDQRRSAEAWTIREHLYHVVGVQEMLLGRLRLMREGPGAVIEPFFPLEAEGPRYPSMEAALDEFARLRVAQAALVKRLRPEVLNRPASHPEYERYSIDILVHHMIYHEYWHLYRMEEIWLTKEEYFDK
jgi:uncharacterized damage-inducible protein DinB